MTHRSDPTLEQILELETRVWDALVAGDEKADAELLAEDFLGVYTDGFAGRSDHCEPLRDGPRAKRYSLDQVSIKVLSTDLVLLAYRATWERIMDTEEARPECMYVSSIWRCVDAQWRNVFSQDTPAILE